MIIVIRCFTCGKVLADKWNYYEKKCYEITKNAKQNAQDDVMFIEDKGQFNDLLDELGINKLCCRRHMLGHVDLIKTI